MESEKILGLDVSTTTIGICLYDITDMKLLELTQVSPKVGKRDNPESSKTKELFLKAEQLGAFLVKYKHLNIKHVVIEEPLLRSNNVNTVGVLLRFNGIVSKMCYDIFNVVPEFVSTYESRSTAFPELMGYNVAKNGKPAKTKTLFGAYPKDIDKKAVVWSLVAKLEPNVVWGKDKKGNLDKKSYDASDAYACARAYMVKSGILKLKI